MRDGDFTGLPPIIDPLTGNLSQITESPRAALTSARRHCLSFVPLPNQAGAGPAGTLNNYVVNIGNISDINRYGARIDHKLTQNDSLWGSFNYSKGDPYFVAQNSPPTYGSWSNGGYKTQNLNLTHVHTFSPRATMSSASAGSITTARESGMNTDFDPRQLFPDLYGPLSVGGLPNINITSHVAIGDYGGFPPGKQFTNQYIDNFTYVRGSHTIKTGIDFANYRVSTPPGTFGLVRASRRTRARALRFQRALHQQHDWRGATGARLRRFPARLSGLYFSLHAGRDQPLLSNPLQRLRAG